jgi:hypothetical protein
MKTFKASIFSIYILSLVFISCTKEGEQGAPGTNGINGQDGNANVQSATLVANSTSNWAWNSTYQWRSAQWTSISILTSSAINSGAVMLYQMDAGIATQLPITVKIGSKTESDFYSYTEGILAVSIQNSNGSDPISQISIPTTYKLVVIPQSAIIANPIIDYNNYYEVKGAFNLKD